MTLEHAGRMVGLILTWYVVAQLVMLAALPFTLRFFAALPDRGYSFGKALGVLLTGVVLWLGVSYGVLRNERGGAWAALLLIAVVSWASGWRNGRVWLAWLRRTGNWRGVLVAEVVFGAAFLLWTVVRMYDPAANHTEKPMDLMFMNSIWASPTYPPQDAWLAGYAISYYYLGYWLVTTLGQLAGTAPNQAYNVAQALWYGLLWLGSFGVVVNLVGYRFDRDAAGDFVLRGATLGAGVLGGVCVALIGNLQVVFEWLYAQGLLSQGAAAALGVYNFPQRAAVTRQWFISYDWWWWRTSRVIEDLNLAGEHIEVIDEFPMFSYVLGDNHPHVLAMPFVLLAIGVALTLFLALWPEDGERDRRWWRIIWRLRWLPGGWVTALMALVTCGSLVFLNTWDFPPYWALLTAVVLLGSQRARQRRPWIRAAAFAGWLLVGTLVLFLPYFLTAQSQAGGLLPNLYHPTRLSQFLIMFGAFLPATAAVLWWSIRAMKPSPRALGGSVGLVLAGAFIFLALGAWLALGTEGGRATLGRLGPLPEGATYGGLLLARRLAAPWTSLITGAGVGVGLACLVALFQQRREMPRDLAFVLLLCVLGLGLLFAPEFVYLRDNFGTRMNTVFKFYYQAWLLLGLATAYAIAVAVRVLPQQIRESAFHGTQALTFASALLVAVCLLFPAAAATAKTGGWRAEQLTLDATAYVGREAPDVLAAVAWIQENTRGDARVLEAKGASYSIGHNRISAMTGRPTLLGWDGHESQWRGAAYGTMASGRTEAIDAIYRTAPANELRSLLDAWEIDYVFVGPVEINQYGIGPATMERFDAAMDRVFVSNDVVIYRRR